MQTGTSGKAHPMSETAYYILLSLTAPRHGYGVMRHVEALTGGRVSLGPGTLYGSLSKMEKDSLISLSAEEHNRRTYVITETGRRALQCEIARITELYLNAKEVMGQ